MEVIIVDYGMGNIGSIINMLKRLGVKGTLSNDKDKILQADKLLLPGVGAFNAGMQQLHASGLIGVLGKKVLQERTPILGICLGMQLFFDRSEEGQLPGLGWIKGEVKRFQSSKGERLRVPHMGWNDVKPKDYHSLFTGLEDEARFYFVHSYYASCKDEKDILGTTLYGNEFVSSVQRDNILGVQFHPEKSHRFGMSILKNFIEYKPALVG